MKIRFSYLSCVALVVLYVALGQGAQEGREGVVYSNFGTGLTFDGDPASGWTINGPLPVGDAQAIAQQFTPRATNTFRGAHIAMTLFSGPGSVDVFLQADANGLPGAVLEQMTVNSLATAPTIVTAISIERPTLLAGTPYWLTVVASVPGVIAGWNWNSIGDVATSDNCAATQGGGPAGPWSPGCFILPEADEPRGAFQINGDAPTAAESLESLLTEIERLRFGGLLSEGGAEALTRKLQASIASLERGNTAAACHQLRAFLNQVTAFTSVGILPELEGRDLTHAADAIRDLTGC